MPATLEIQDDAGNALTSFNFGAVDGGAYLQQRFRVQNIGDSQADSVELYLARLGANDGLDFAELAEDASGSPDTYTTNPITLASLAASAIAYFWARISIPSGSTPAGNPRQVDWFVKWRGT
jgi:hypothetical protein